MVQLVRYRHQAWSALGQKGEIRGNVMRETLAATLAPTIGAGIAGVASTAFPGTPLAARPSAVPVRPEP